MSNIKCLIKPSSSKSEIIKL